MEKIKTILIDDERLARVELKNQLTAFSWVEVVGEAAHAREGINLIQQYQPDLIFLDIQMPEMTGFDLLEQLENAPPVIFMTAYDEYAIKAFEFNALDYLLKPVHTERLQESLERVRNRSKFTLDEQNNKEQLPPYADQLYLKDGDQHEFVRLDEVSLFSSFGNYVKVHVNKKAILVHRSLNHIESRIEHASFFRANRYSIVNLKKITGIRQGSRGKLIVQLESGHEIELSERKSVVFRERWSV